MTPHPESQLLTRARGALLAHAAGSRLSNRGETDGKPAALARLFSESLLERGEFDVADVSRRWVHWMDQDGRGLGLTTRRALELIVSEGADIQAALDDAAAEVDALSD